MCSCGSPDEAVVIWTRQSSATKSCLYVRQEVIAEDKEANDYSWKLLISFNSTLKKLFTQDVLMYPTRKTFSMWKIARIDQGNHKKAWEQEIRREHNSNPLQRQSHVLVVFPCFPCSNNYITQFLLVVWWPIPIYLLYIHFGMCGHIIMMICDELMFLIHAVLIMSTGTHSPSMRINMHGPYWWPACMEGWKLIDGSGTQSII